MAAGDKISIIFACYPSIYSAIVLKKLLDEKSIRVAAVVESRCIKRRGIHPLFDIAGLLKVSGLRYAVYMLWITSLFAILSRFGKVPSIASLCEASRIQRFATLDINADMRVQALLREAPNKSAGKRCYFLTAMFNQKLSAEFLALEGISFINLHPGQLPAYRGVDPVFAALLNGEPEGVVTLHETRVELDAGDILATRPVHFEPWLSLQAENKKMFEAGADMLAAFFAKNGEQFNVEAKPQEGSVGYYGWPSREEVREFSRERALI